MVNVDILCQDSEVWCLVREFSDVGKMVVVICYGFWLLIDVGVVCGKILIFYFSVCIDLINVGVDWVDMWVKVCLVNGWILIILCNLGDLQVFNEVIGEVLQVVV